RHVQSADSGSRQVRVATDAADDTDRQAAPHDLRVSGYQHAHVVQGRKRAGQGGRDIGQATGLDQVGQFGCNEEDLFLALLHAAQLQQRALRRRLRRTQVIQAKRPCIYSSNTHNTHSPARHSRAATSTFLPCEGRKPSPPNARLGFFVLRGCCKTRAVERAPISKEDLSVPNKVRPLWAETGGRELAPDDRFGNSTNPVEFRICKTSPNWSISSPTKSSGLRLRIPVPVA